MAEQDTWYSATSDDPRIVTSAFAAAGVLTALRWNPSKLDYRDALDGIVQARRKDPMPWRYPSPDSVVSLARQFRDRDLAGAWQFAFDRAQANAQSVRLLVTGTDPGATGSHKNPFLEAFRTLQLLTPISSDPERPGRVEAVSFALLRAAKRHAWAWPPRFDLIDEPSFTKLKLKQQLARVVDAAAGIVSASTLVGADVTILAELTGAALRKLRARNSGLTIVSTSLDVAGPQRDQLLEQIAQSSAMPMALVDASRESLSRLEQTFTDEIAHNKQLDIALFDACRLVGLSPPLLITANDSAATFEDARIENRVTELRDRLKNLPLSAQVGKIEGVDALGIGPQARTVRDYLSDLDSAIEQSRLIFDHEYNGGRALESITDAITRIESARPGIPDDGGSSRAPQRRSPAAPAPPPPMSARPNDEFGARAVDRAQAPSHDPFSEATPGELTGEGSGTTAAPAPPPAPPMRARRSGGTGGPPAYGGGPAPSHDSVSLPSPDQAAGAGPPPAAASAAPDGGHARRPAPNYQDRAAKSGSEPPPPPGSEGPGGANPNDGYSGGPSQDGVASSAISPSPLGPRMPRPAPPPFIGRAQPNDGHAGPPRKGLRDRSDGGQPSPPPKVARDLDLRTGQLEEASAPFTAFPRIEAPDHVEAGVSFEFGVGFSAVTDRDAELQTKITLLDATPGEDMFVLVAAENGRILGSNYGRLPLKMDAIERFDAIPAEGCEFIRLSAEYFFRNDHVGTVVKSVSMKGCSSVLDHPVTIDLFFPALKAVVRQRLELVLLIKLEEPGWLTLQAVDVNHDRRSKAIRVQVGNAKEHACQLDKDQRACGYKGFAGHSAVEGIGQKIGLIIPQPILDDYIQPLLGGEKIPHILILTNEPYIPWELALVDVAGSERPQYLGSAARIGRWWVGARMSPAPVDLKIERITAISADSYSGAKKRELPEAKAEKQWLCDKFSANPVVANFDPVVEWLKTLPIGPGHLAHLALHGYTDNSADETALILGDGKKIIPTLLAGIRITKKDPRFQMVFLNACQVGITGQSLGQIAGFPGELLTAGTGAVIGPIWEINDVAAHQLAQEFYDMTFNQTIPVSEALRQLRAKCDKSDSTTPLAYIFYGHPGLVLQREKSAVTIPA